jgi:hypothetical protein
MDQLTLIVFLLVAGLLGVFVFGLLHLRPLTVDEILRLSEKRRHTEVRRYFTYDQTSVAVNKDFKTKMRPDGQFYIVNDSLSGFPSKAAALIKGKKHEWVICAFERNKSIDLIWLNKGIKAEVSIGLTLAQIVQVATTHNYTSVLRFHNHPNSNPNRYDLLMPSQQDIISTKFYAAQLEKFGINFIDFVCERGRFKEFSLTTPNNFMPLGSFRAAVEILNGTSRIRNLLLHIERIF